MYTKINNHFIQVLCINMYFILKHRKVSLTIRKRFMNTLITHTNKHNVVKSGRCEICIQYSLSEVNFNPQNFKRDYIIKVNKVEY